MGSLVLRCPMCCDETFNNLQLLKDHLLTMNNLYCPNGCSFRSETVADLIQHLDECIQVDDVTFGGDSCEINDNENDHQNVEDLSDDFLVNDDGIMTINGSQDIQADDNEQFEIDQVNCDIKNEYLELNEITDNDNLDNNDDTNDEFLYQTIEDNLEESQVLYVQDTDGIIKDDSMIETFQDDTIEYIDAEQNFIEIDQQEQMPIDDLVDTDNTYNYCNICEISFESFKEHMAEFHPDLSATQIKNDDDNDEDIYGDVETIIPEETPVPLTIKPQRRSAMQTLRVEHCTDEEGRSYMRKVVQIEPFWDRTNTTNETKPTSMIEKFFSSTKNAINNNKIRGNNQETSETLTGDETKLQRPYRCQQCLKLFTHSGEFRLHVCVNGKNQCKLCDKAFATIKALQTHLKYHIDCKKNEIFKCTICGTEFTSHKSLRLHARMHAPVRSRRIEAPEGDSKDCFTCKECGKILSESYKDAHMALHTSDAVTCEICNRKFGTTESLEMHRAVHQELGITKNQLTNETDIPQPDPLSLSPDSPVPRNSSPTKVTSSDPPDPSKPYQCQYCPKRFRRPHEKVKHERIHTGEKPHICEVCGKTFRVSFCLTLHMRTHTGVRPYECKVCNKKFKASSVYNHHVLTHGDARAYKCDYCTKTFKTRVQLAGHKNSHTKPFHCTECSRPFASLYAARNHIETHKKDNNLKFTCHICGASYGRAFALNDHMKSHADNDDNADDDLQQTLQPPEAAREEEVQDDYIMNEEITEEELINDSSVIIG
ncbi:zinc finger protein 716-like isoform X2 [Aphidius gifuensis]|uniref:zinc finger protein 716-like isoform X2 n=1 Tax=Aphidius gifuensis TaxID=684658 RepID=UPI001CDC0EB9|nr:zinc finger protein 716-like isoform X2 [Aphidius gifuensis]